MPVVGGSAGFAFIVWCSIALAACVFLVLNPSKFFSLLAWRRPLPKTLQNRWVLLAYRLIAVVILVRVLGLLIQFLRS